MSGRLCKAMVTLSVLGLSSALAPPALAQPIVVDQITGQYADIVPVQGIGLPEFSLVNGSVTSPSVLAGQPVNDVGFSLGLSAGVVGGSVFGFVDVLYPDNLFSIGGAILFLVTNPGFLEANPAQQTALVVVPVSLSFLDPELNLDLSLLQEATLAYELSGVIIEEGEVGDGFSAASAPRLVATWNDAVTPVTTGWRITPAAIPEPGTAVLALTGLAALAGFVGRRRRR